MGGSSWVFIGNCLVPELSLWWWWRSWWWCCIIMVIKMVTMMMVMMKITMVAIKTRSQFLSSHSIRNLGKRNFLTVSIVFFLGFFCNLWIKFSVPYQNIYLNPFWRSRIFIIRANYIPINVRKSQIAAIFLKLIFWKKIFSPIPQLAAPAHPRANRIKYLKRKSVEIAIQKFREL